MCKVAVTTDHATYFRVDNSMIKLILVEKINSHDVKRKYSVVKWFYNSEIRSVCST